MGHVPALIFVADFQIGPQLSGHFGGQRRGNGGEDEKIPAYIVALNSDLPFTPGVRTRVTSRLKTDVVIGSAVDLFGKDRDLERKHGLLWAGWKR
jgi:hypothetical protein